MSTVSEKVVAAVCLVLIFVAGAGVGYGLGVGRSQDKITQVATDKGDAQSDARAATATLDEIRRRLGVQGEELTAAQRTAAEALRERDATKAEMARRARQEETNLRMRAHEAPDCESLARMPICSVVADGLWGDAQTGSTAGGSH